MISHISAAKPKIADYHFTTITPNLGLVKVDEGHSFVMADIPGLIEGAADGAGLGHRFLRHTERTKVLIHVLDISGSEGRDPLDDFAKVNAELEKYNAKLIKRPMVIAANKSFRFPLFQVRACRRLFIAYGSFWRNIKRRKSRKRRKMRSK